MEALGYVEVPLRRASDDLQLNRESSGTRNIASALLSRNSNVKHACSVDDDRPIALLHATKFYWIDARNDMATGHFTAFHITQPGCQDTSLCEL